ncbi:MAG: hypothetical protein ISR64_04900 [Deltaproteobacteria bacterium]|nr:hypothetical protein [Deltaproteobacteria bacterium]
MKATRTNLCGNVLVPVVVLVFSGLLTSCESHGTSPGGDTGGWDAVACATSRPTRVVALDIWGRRLDGISVTVNGVSYTGDAEVDLAPGTAIDVLAEAEGHFPGTARFTLSGDPASPPVATGLSEGVRTAWSLFQAAGCPRTTLYLGLDHLWFAGSGRPARSGNQVDLLMDGEELWEKTLTDLAMAQSHIRGSTWWWQSDFEMVRPEGHESLTEEQRRANTALAVLDQVPAVKRLLINRFSPDSVTGAAYMNTDPDIRLRGTTPDDGFEVMLQGNGVAVPLSGTWEGVAPDFSFGHRVAAGAEFMDETFPGDDAISSAVTETFDAASFHQKAFAMDGRVAYISGMNVKSTDWDTSEHRVFDSGRMKFATGNDERLRVKQKLQLPDLGPRKDYGIRVEGPAAMDVDDVLRVRWDLGIEAMDMYWEQASPFPLLPPAAETGSTVCQVVATQPPPITEQSILETWIKALSNATSFVFIEDQYFRMPILNQVILDTLLARPWVTLVVVTKPVSFTDGGKKFTVESDGLFRDNAPQRYLLLQLKSFDAVERQDPQPGDETDTFYFVNMDVHSKILIVDDLYLSVGSCNKNNRGLLYEGELNLSVLDGTWTREARRRIYRNLVGPALAGQVSDDPDANFALLGQTAEHNAGVEAFWHEKGAEIAPGDIAATVESHHPEGFVYPLSFTPDYLLEVGPDVF